MSSFDRAAAERRLGPAVVAAARRQVAAAPLLTVERREQLRAVFATARHRQAAQQKAA